MDNGVDDRAPDRWLECPPFGEVIPDIKASQRFIPLKTPLGANINLPPDYHFTPQIFLDQMREKRINVGLIINLTFTNRYYDINQMMDDFENIEYKQISCRGHNEAPQHRERAEFIQECSRFFKRNPTKVIAVHCTHGFNRTGFMICSYLTSVCDWEITAAINEFSQKRPPGIYKEDYLRELVESYGDSEDPIPPCPPKPNWDAEDGLTLDLSQVAETTNETGSQEINFYEGINDVELVKDRALVHRIYRHCCHLCNFGENSPNIKFPGGQPVSLDRVNIQLLASDRYRVSWKADGERYMLYIQDQEHMFFLTRNLNLWRISGLTFPKLEDLNSHLTDTLMDGEMVTDIDQDARIPRFLIYDVISLNGQIVANDDFDKRCHIIRDVICKARLKAKQAQLIQSENEPFKVREKSFYPLHAAKKTWDLKVSHEKDGLIFQPLKAPYLGGTCPHILKWKPPHLNSIDFRIRICHERKEGCLPESFAQLHVSNQTMPMFNLKIDKSRAHFKQYEGKIVEMSIPDRKNWIILRERTDKKAPNSRETACAVMKSISEPVTEQMLLNFISKIPQERPPK